MTDTVMVAGIAAAASIISAGLGVVIRKKVGAVHVIVNGNLEAARREIQELHRLLREARGDLSEETPGA